MRQGHMACLFPICPYFPTRCCPFIPTSVCLFIPALTREKLRGSLFRISLENGEIPSVFVVCANMIDEEGYIEQSRPHVFGCWDNAVYRAVMLDSSNPDARVFIVAKRSIEDATFSVVWDNVWIVDDQQFVEAGIRMKMKRAENLKKRKEAKSNCCPFPEDEYAYQKSENP